MVTVTSQLARDQTVQWNLSIVVTVISQLARYTHSKAVTSYPQVNTTISAVGSTVSLHTLTSAPCTIPSTNCNYEFAKRCNVQRGSLSWRLPVLRDSELNDSE